MAALTNLTADLGGRALHDAVTAGGSIVQKAASENANRSSGAGHYPGGGHAGDHIIMQVDDLPGEAKAYVGPDADAWYLRFQELGDGTNPADPFLRNAADENEAEIKAAMAAELAKHARRVAK
jgi:HK97 gp10 family phage protein